MACGRGKMGDVSWIVCGEVTGLFSTISASSRFTGDLHLECHTVNVLFPPRESLQAFQQTCCWKRYTVNSRQLLSATSILLLLLYLQVPVPFSAPLSTQDALLPSCAFQSKVQTLISMLLLQPFSMWIIK